MKYIGLVFLCIFLFGCATAQETTQLRQTITATDSELSGYRGETDRKLTDLARDNDNMRKQLVNLSSIIDEKGQQMKTVLGKLDELEFQLRTHVRELKGEISMLKKTEAGPPEGSLSLSPQPPQPPADCQPAYKDAFDAFQKKQYKDAIEKFSTFAETCRDTPLAPNAFFWMGESYMNLKNYEKAVLSYQELADKHPKSDMVPRALLAQAQAFQSMKDKKSSITVLKKIMELFPKSNEAAIAERRLRDQGL
jgi:tol-pal system protein YbgF